MIDDKYLYTKCPVCNGTGTISPGSKYSIGAVAQVCTCKSHGDAPGYVCIGVTYTELMKYKQAHAQLVESRSAS